VDIHTHILPGVDDGAQDMEQAMALLRTAWENGTGAVVLTPHYRGRYRDNTPEQLRDGYELLRRQAAAELPGLELFLGNEAGMEIELAEKLAQGRVLSLNGGNYVLLEFRGSSTGAQIVRGVLDILNCGFTPIIAHAERYQAFRKDRQIADEVLGLGAMIQINASGVTGKAGFAQKWCCSRLLRRGQVQFVASDAHDLERRSPVLMDCYRQIERKYGAHRAARLFWENAREILTENKD
jgi:protein-tyrosine phosphatase